MSVKEHITQEVKKIANEGKTVDEKIIAFVKDDFHKTLADSEKTGASVEQATRDTLEGVEAGLKAGEHKTKDILSKSADAIADETRDFIVQSLDTARSHANNAKALLDKAVNESFQGMDNLKTKNKEGMEKAYAALYKKTTEETAKLREVSEGIREYAENKTQELDDATCSALQKIAEKTKLQLNTLKQTSEEHSKKLLQHSHPKVSEWLGKLKDKVHHKV
ncbi:MAG: hypothetical protein GWP10_00455 [Nitrospiraceae bacterium]|nr:hypothetical protein [Nitrospiraceae bacterium]